MALKFFLGSLVVCIIFSVIYYHEKKESSTDRPFESHDSGTVAIFSFFVCIFSILSMILSIK